MRAGLFPRGRKGWIFVEYLIGVDLGTSGTKTVLFDVDGNVVASKTIEYPLYQEKNGWAEQDPLDWWNAAADTIRAVVTESGVNNADIKGLGISGQMHGLVMLDRDGNVLRRSIIWCDQRTAKECEEITARVGAKRLIEITANPALTGFTASKILWVRNNEPEIYEKCAHILLPKDYVRYMLTGDFATEVSDASGMQLLDVPNRCWSDEVLEKLEIDKALLPKVYESPEITGVISEEAAKRTGLLAGTIVVGGAGDNAAAAVGTGVVEDGKAFTTIGTSGVVFAHTDKISIDPKGRVHTFCCAVPGAWHVMGVTQGAGLSLKWFRDNFCSAEKETAAGMGVDPYYLMDQQAARAPIGCKPPDLPAVPDGRAHAAPRPGLPRRVHRPFRDAHEIRHAARRDGGRHVLPARQCGDPEGHGRLDRRHARVRRRRNLEAVAPDARRHVQLRGAHGRLEGGPGARRRDPRRRRRRPVPLGAGGLPPRDPPESAAGSDRGERAEVRGLLPHVHAALPRAQGLLQGARRALIFRNTPHCAGSRRFPAQYLCMSNQRTTTS